MVLMEQHVSAYSEGITRFTNVSYRRLLTVRGLWQVLRAHHLGLTKLMGEKLHVGEGTESVMTGL